MSNKTDEFAKLRQKGVFDTPIKAFEYIYQLKRENKMLSTRIKVALEELDYPTLPWDETVAAAAKALRGEHE